MHSRWNEKNAAKATTDLDLRAYSSRLIGADTELVLHGGGNTSVKSTHVDHFGEVQDIIWVKASGFDLSVMGPEGFTALDQNRLLKLATLDELSDPDMVNEVLGARLDAKAAAASIEAIAHALIPFKFVDHTHADAILTISNSPDGSDKFREIYGGRVLILPYIKPGFDLAKQFNDVIEANNIGDWDAIILEHHGIFTYSDDARDSYDKMITAVGQAEKWLVDTYGDPEAEEVERMEALDVAEIRAKVSALAGFPVLSVKSDAISPSKAIRYAQLTRGGTLTPEHVIHNKPYPAYVGQDVQQGLADFDAEYTGYFERAGDADLVMLPRNPHWAIFESGHTRSFGRNLKKAQISSDVGAATLNAMYYADQMGGWKGLSEQDLRDLEYWELEQSKLKRQKPPSALTGKVAVVTGAADGIGAACAKRLFDQGAVVVGLDINPSILTSMPQAGFEGRQLDLRDDTAIKEALDDVVDTYGGLDIVVSNAGIFRAGATIDQMSDGDWSDTLDVNLTSHQKLLAKAIPYLKHSIDGGVVFIGSRNVTAPGAGAAAYSVSKAGLTQLARVAALELAPYGVTVNVVHPDAVFDTKLWTEEALQSSATRYGLTVEEYKTRNLLKAEIKSSDIALAVSAFVDGTLSCTTGAQLPIDGGNDRVI